MATPTDINTLGDLLKVLCPAQLKEIEARRGVISAMNLPGHFVNTLAAVLAHKKVNAGLPWNCDLNNMKPREKLLLSAKWR